MLDTLYLVHHSHTDVGFTHEQPVVFDLHAQFIDQAIELCEQTKNYPRGSALKWTCESLGMLLYWLERRSSRQIRRFLELEKQGDIEVSGTFAVFSQCISHESMYRQFYAAERLRNEYGIKITTAMHCDINGQNWGMVEAMLDCGIDAFAMSINENVGRAAFNKLRPNGFYWQGASGRKILCWNGLHYNNNNFFSFPGDWHDTMRGVPTDPDKAVKKLPAFIAWLKKRDYPYPFCLFQVTYTTFVDNGPPDLRLADFVQWWNGHGHSPRMEIVTLRDFFQELRKEPAQRLPVHRGEWTDYWNFGAASTAYETALSRRTCHRIFEAEFAMSLGNARERQDELSQAWENTWWWDEHTWGANTSILHPFRQPARSQLNQKLNFAYRARSFAQLLRLESIDELARSLAGSSGYYIMAVNVLPWKREERLHIPSSWLDSNAAATVSHVQSLDRIELAEQQDMAEQAVVVTAPISVPAMGYRLISATELKVMPLPSQPGRRVRHARAENSVLRVELDSKRGGIKSLFDKFRSREWVDAKSPWTLGGYVHETVGGAADDPYRGRMKIFENADWSKFMGYRGWHADWPAVRRGVSRVVEQTSTVLPGQTLLTQKCLAPGTLGVNYEISLPDEKPYVDVRITIEKTWDTTPEACYVAFPFALRGSQPRYQTAGGVVRPHLDQLPDSNQDFHTAQLWVDISNNQCGVTITTVDAPIVMFGGFNIARMFNKPRRRIPPLFLSLAMTNYYHTNYAGGQLGSVTFHYRIIPHDQYDPSESTRAAMEAAYPLLSHPVMNPSGGKPPVGSLLEVTNPAIVPLAIKPSEDGKAIILRLFNVSQSPEKTKVIFSSRELLEVWRCDNLENVKSRIKPHNNSFEVEMPSCSAGCFRISLSDNWSTLPANR